MPTSPEIPLALYQILEEEYNSLHGPVRGEQDFVELPGDKKAGEWRRVKAKRDWFFYEGHLRDSRSFARRLLPTTPPQGSPTPRADAPSVQPFGTEKNDLRVYLRSKLSPAQLKSVDECAQSDVPVPAGLTRQLESALNKNILPDKNLYDSDRFVHVSLSEASKRFVNLWSCAETFQGDDLIRFNRLLLEDAFPEAIESLHNIRLAAIHRHFHEQKQAALCLSGGGIRSGTFALGLIQGLARHSLLEKFDYLSTVSGGGYIGGWLTAWLHRHPRGLEGVTEDLANSAPRAKIDPDAAPIRYLRQYSNFITPKVGLLTADTWTFIGIYLRNLFLNGMVFVPLLIAVLLLPRLLLAVTLMQPIPPPDLFGLPGLHFRHIFLLAGFVSGVWALAYINFHRPGMREQLEEHSRFWRGRADQGHFLRWCLLPLLVAAFCLTTYWAWSRDAANTGKDIGAFLLFGSLFTVAGWVIAALILRRPLRVKQFAGLGVLALAGLVGGFVGWLMSQHPIGDPVIRYGGTRPFPWTDPTTPLTDWKTEWYVCLGVPIFLLIFLLGTSIYVGLSSTSKGINDEDREWWARFSAWVIILIIAWVVSCALVIFGPIALLSFPTILASLGGLSGLIALIVGRSAKSPATSRDEAQGGKTAALMGSLLPLLALIFLAVLVAALSLGTTGMIQGLAMLADQQSRPKPPPEVVAPANRTFNVEWLTKVPGEPSGRGFNQYLEYIKTPAPQRGGTDAAPRLSLRAADASAEKKDDEQELDAFNVAKKMVHLNVLHHTSFWFITILLLFLSAFGTVLARIINLNVFSLHGGYRNRLIRGFLGASRPAGERKPNPFTGFDPKDNIYMHELRPTLLDEGDLLNPGLLAAALKAALQGQRTDPLSSYLAQNKLLGSVEDDLRAYQPDARVPAQLVANLRATLNSVLQKENIRLAGEASLQHYAQTDRAVRTRQAIDAGPRSEYHILLNRLIMEQAYPGALKSCPNPPPPYKLLHVINTGLNLVGGDNLAWQQRKAEPFTITPLHAGCYRLGYRRSRDYGGKDTNGISIGTAAAISGAAASSNMGYYTTSPVISLLLTLFNVRLGWWLGNPGPAGAFTYQLGSPKYSFKPVVDEAFGLTNDRNKYVYLTDGGHFENLALYEMVLRRCHIIVASDGAQDEEYRFGDLGNAVRKIRIDLGVPIEFTSVPIYAGPESKERGKGGYWAIGKIRYSCIDPKAPDGVLLYIKPAVYGNEPRDVLEYKENFPAFPHQSTGDQFFDEPQFESYRMLGSYIMEQICGSQPNKLQLHEMIEKAFKQLTDESGGIPAVDPQLKTWLPDLLRIRRPLLSIKFRFPWQTQSGSPSQAIHIRALRRGKPLSLFVNPPSGIFF